MNNTRSSTPAHQRKKLLYTNPDRKPVVLPVNPDGIPAELKAVPRWVLWALTWKANRNGGGKWDKVPKTVAGRNASSTDPKTWGTFEEVLAAYKTGRYAGIGFVLGDGFTGIDLDDVRDADAGELVPWAGELLAEAGTYADVSPSGTGVKLFGRGEWANDWNKKPHPSGTGEIEVYSTGRYFTLTGRPERHEQTGVGDLQPVLASLDSLFHRTPTFAPTPANQSAVTDDHLLARIRRSEQGEKFVRLWDGDATEYDGDESRADLALCSTLAFWCGGDPARIDRLFRRSGLIRDKWDAKRGNSTYGRVTIEKALDGRTEFHTSEREMTGNEPTDPPTPPATPPPWPEPMADEAFYGLAGEVVRALDPYSEADPTAVLVQLLVMFGNLVGRGPHYAVGGDRHFTNQFAVLVGPTGGGRKGTSAGMVKLVLDGIDDDWLGNRNVSGVSSGEGLLWAIRDAITKRERVSKGRSAPPVYEEVEADPGVADKRLMVQEPEFATVLKQNERQGNTASAVLRQLWDGLPVVQTLTKNSPAKATNAHVSLIGHITPEELHRYLSATESANGFANRFLFACVRRSKLLPDGGQVNPDVLAPLQRRLSEAAEFARRVGQVRRHPSADRLWHGVYSPLSRERYGLSGALTARAAPQVLRLAVLYALLDRSAVIRPPHLLAAIAVWDFCERSVEHLFADRTGNPVADEIRDLLRAAPNGLTRTDLVAAFNRHQHGDKLTTALVTLEGAGLARRVKENTGGRPAERWYASGGGVKSSRLMVTARELAGRCDEGDGSELDATPCGHVPPFDRFDLFGRTAVTDTPRPLCEDPQQFHTLLESRGWKWHRALEWLSAPPSTGFFEVSGDDRRRLADHLERSPPVPNPAAGGQFAVCGSGEAG